MHFGLAVGTSTADEVRRARKALNIVVLRRLRENATQRIISLTAAPFASEEDAKSYLPKTVIGIVRKPFSKVSVTEEGVVAVDGLDRLPGSIVYEIRYVGPAGTGGDRIIATSVGKIVLTMTFTSASELWPWSTALSLAELQVNRIQEVQGDSLGFL